MDVTYLLAVVAIGLPALILLRQIDKVRDENGQQFASEAALDEADDSAGSTQEAVSYTHLTLPTKRIV